MNYEQTADAIARNIWEISTGNGRDIEAHEWDSHRAKCEAAVEETHTEEIDIDEWQRRALERLAGNDIEQIDKPAKPRRIDATPTWEGIMPALVAVIENGTGEGRKNAVEELMRLARAADRYIADSKADAAARGEKYQAIIWTKDRAESPVTILLMEGQAQDVAAYIMPGHNPATAGIAEHGAKISEAAARAYGGSWPAHLTYRR